MSVYGFAPATQIYKYRLVREIGSSQSDVWEALDTATNTVVAVKLLDAANAPVAHRLYEAQVGSKFKHPNLAEVLYADVVNVSDQSNPTSTVQYVLIASPYYPRGSITRDLEGPSILRASTVLKVLVNVLTGLEYLHENGCFHNDIKPGNILVGEHSTYLLTDYGISWTSATPTSSRGFYKPHVTPETVANSCSHLPSVQTDIYQLGVTAYCLLNGVGYMSDKFLSLGEKEFMIQVKDGRLPDRASFQPWVPALLRQVIIKALSVDPSQRFISALEMRRAIEKCFFPFEWIFDQNGDLVFSGRTYTLAIVERPVSPGAVMVEARKNFPTGNSITVKKSQMLCRNSSQVKKQKAKIMQMALKDQI